MRCNVAGLFSRRIPFLLGAALLAFASFLAAQEAAPIRVQEAPMHTTRVALREGWQLLSSCGANFDGAALSTASFRPDSTWITTTVPSTVLAAQLAAGQFRDPFYGMSLRSIPGTDYPIERRSAGSGVVRLTNPGKNVAFLANASAVDPQSGELIAPIFWNDNFVSLLPGEARVLTIFNSGAGQTAVLHQD